MMDRQYTELSGSVAFADAEVLLKQVAMAVSKSANRPAVAEAGSFKAGGIAGLD